MRKFLQSLGRYFGPIASEAFSRVAQVNTFPWVRVHGKLVNHEPQVKNQSELGSEQYRSFRYDSSVVEPSPSHLEAEYHLLRRSGRSRLNFHKTSTIGL
jgi:hypothetical protein